MCAPTEITEINLGQIIDDAGILTLEDLVTDGWQKFNDKLTMFIFKNTAQSVLLIKLNDQMDGSAPILGQVVTGNTNLNILRYKCNRLNTPVYQGTPVVFVLEQQKKKYHLHCEKGEKSEPTIRVVPGMPPTDISNSQSGYIFHQKIFSGQYYQFESALHREWYVCSTFQGQRHTIGLKKTEKKVDETVLFKVA